MNLKQCLNNPLLFCNLSPTQLQELKVEKSKPKNYEEQTHTYRLVRCKLNEGLCGHAQRELASSEGVHILLS